MHIRISLLAIVSSALLGAAAIGRPAQAPAVESQQPLAEGAADVRAMLDDGRYACAEERARELVARARREGRERTREGADLLGLLARSSWLGGRSAAPETMACAERALEISA